MLFKPSGSTVYDTLAFARRTELGLKYLIVADLTLQVTIVMIKMRNNWDEVRLNSFQGNDELSLSQHSVSDENKSRYDFGIADRSISAPPPSGMGFDVSTCIFAMRIVSS